MDYDIKNVNAKANAGMATGITALGIEAAGLLSQNGGLGGLLGGIFGNGTQNLDAAAIIAALNNSKANSTDLTALLAMLPSLMAMVATAGSGSNCNEDHVVNRYEAAKDAEIARLETEIKLRDANTYTLGEINKLRNYLEERLAVINGQLCAQAVKNQETADAFQLVRQDIAQERSERKCADNAIVNYSNATFYAKQVADVTTGTGTTAQTLYNPLPNCGC